MVRFSDLERRLWSISARAIYSRDWELRHDTAAYCPHNKHSLLPPPKLTSTVGVSGGLSSFRSFTFLSFLPGRPSSPLINSLGRKTHTDASRPGPRERAVLLFGRHLPVVPVALLEQVIILYVHVLTLPGRLVVG